MAKSKKEKGLVIGGAIVGLLIGGSALGATHTTADQGNEFFKYKEFKAAYQLAAADEKEEVKKTGDEENAEKKDENTADEKTAEKKTDEKSCGEGSCG